MKVRLLRSRVVSDDRGRTTSQQAGDIVDLPGGEAYSLIENGMAERVVVIRRLRELMGVSEAKKLEEAGEVEILPDSLEARVLEPARNMARRVGRLAGVTK